MLINKMGHEDTDIDLRGTNQGRSLNNNLITIRDQGILLDYEGKLKKQVNIIQSAGIRRFCHFLCMIDPVGC